LPPSASDARICSFECTFCSACVERLQNVCPNCGGGFCPRPIRPARDWNGGNDLAHYPPSQRERHRPVDWEAHAAFAARIRAIPPEQR
jgi:hypothetical protein